MKLTNIVKILSIGIIALFITGCGSSSSSSGSTSGVSDGSSSVSDGSSGTTSEYPLAPSGNYKLLPGYKYDCDKSEVYEMFVRERGNVMFAPAPLSFNIFDGNFKEYYPENQNNNYVYGGSSYTFNAGHYYIAPYECAERNHEQTFSVQSNVLE